MQPTVMSPFLIQKIFLSIYAVLTDLSNEIAWEMFTEAYSSATYA